MNPRMIRDMPALNSGEHRRGDPPAARGALWVNYNCGQSQPWSALSRADIERLEALSMRMRIARGK